METTIDPYKVLNLPKNYNKEMLRNAYKQMALKAHPDKGGSEYLFKLVTQCYKFLYAELKKRNADKQYYELKNDFLKSNTETEKNSKEKPTLQNMFYNGSRFDQQKFNKFFEDNKIKDEVNEIGYKEWMQKHKVKDAPKYRGSFNQDGFNSHFEKHSKMSKDHKQIIKYQEPEALVTVKKLGFTELGQDNIDDFSGENKSMKHLNYMDYKIAHTTSRIIDPKTVQRQNFRNVQDLEKARENVQYQMTEEQYLEQLKIQKLQKKQEEQRQMNIRNHDNLVEQQYYKLQQLLK